MKEYKAIKVPASLHQEFKVLSVTEGEDMIQMLKKLIAFYKGVEIEKNYVDMPYE
jgi:uncharacterized small protein (DUF1192 family)